MRRAAPRRAAPDTCARVAGANRQEVSRCRPGCGTASLVGSAADGAGSGVPPAAARVMRTSAEPECCTSCPRLLHAARVRYALVCCYVAAMESFSCPLPQRAGACFARDLRRRCGLITAVRPATPSGRRADVDVFRQPSSCAPPPPQPPHSSKTNGCFRVRRAGERLLRLLPAVGSHHRRGPRGVRLQGFLAGRPARAAGQQQRRGACPGASPRLPVAARAARASCSARARGRSAGARCCWGHERFSVGSQRASRRLRRRRAPRALLLAFRPPGGAPARVLGSSPVKQAASSSPTSRPNRRSPARASPAAVSLPAAGAPACEALTRAHRAGVA